MNNLNTDESIFKVENINSGNTLIFYYLYKLYV